jgi:hypothetical protein
VRMSQFRERISSRAHSPKPSGNMGDDYTGAVTVAADDGTERELANYEIWSQSETIMEMVKGASCPPAPCFRRRRGIRLFVPRCCARVRTHRSRCTHTHSLRHPPPRPLPPADTDPGDTIPLASVGKDALDKTVEYMEQMAKFKADGTSEEDKQAWIDTYKKAMEPQDQLPLLFQTMTVRQV